MSFPGRKRYCIFGCIELGAYMHSFPHPERRSDLFKTWVSIVGDKLKETDPWKIYKNKRICDHHFVPDQKVASHRLKNMAVPSLNLSGLVLSPGLCIQLEHNYSHPNIHENTADLSQPHFPSITTDKALEERLNPNDQPSTSKMYSMNDMKSSENLKKKYKTAQKTVRSLKSKLRKSIKKQKNFKARLANATSFLQNGGDSFERVTKNMTRSGKIFTGMQYRQALKKPKGRRYNVEEKVLALSIFIKKSPKCYNLLSRYFKLPSSKSLRNLLSDIKIAPGINEAIFQKLKETVDGLNEEDRLCTLIFDEMSITPHILYNSASDKLNGFVSHNSGLTFANHALVFMVKGIKMKFKQPVAYYFVQSLKTEEMKNIINEVITNIKKTGLKVICTVCDQGATNVSAINSLVKDTRVKYLKEGKEWRQDFFQVKGEKIIPIFDVPHLLKGLRNNLLTKDLIYKEIGDAGEELKTVKWKFFEMLYDADKTRGELRCLHKLSEEHIIPAKIKKMRVKMAAQIFSHSVAVTTDHFIARGMLPEECRQLVPFVLLIDKLFDSLNAGTFHVPNGKLYRGPVRKNSPHHKLWMEAIIFLKNMKYVAKKKNGDKIRLVETTIPSITNFIKTIEGIRAVWKLLNEKYSLDCMLTRNFNQDPVENFFGNIRSLGARNVSPNCNSFESAFKTLLLNNFSSHQAVNANCEEDFNTCLQTLDFFLKEKKKITEKAKDLDIEISEGLYEALSTVPTGDTSSAQNRYVCGWVLRKCLTKIVKKCQTCRQSILSNKENERNCYIRAKEYDKNKQWLCYPSDQLETCFQEIQHITVTFLKTNLKKEHVKENIKCLTNSFVIFPCNCEEHKEALQNYFTETAVNILIFSWCRSINRILSGKITNEDNDDPLKRSAQLYYLTHKTRK